MEAREELPDFRGKTVVVTGATSGIGRQSALLFARQGARVIAVGRNREKAAAVLDEIAVTAAAAGAPEPRFEYADLSSMAQILALGERLRAEPDGIDVLAHVAGWYGDRRLESDEGLELQWAVNHLAPFALTTTLLPSLSRRSRAKVLVVSSDSHYFGRIRWRDPDRRRFYVGILAYAQSKLANVLFVRELHRREGARLDAYAVDPGLVDTEVGSKHASVLTRAFWSFRRHRGTGPEVPAALILFLAGSLEAAGRGGLYWRDRAALRPAGRALDDAAATRLWKLSEEEVAAALDRGNAPRK